MAKVIDVLPEITGEEQMLVASLLSDMDDITAQKFANVYRTRRRDPQTILLLALVGFLGFAGIHRFIIDQVGWGILYFFTAGLCFIGTIVDIVNYKQLAFEYNQRMAQEAAAMVK